MPDKISATESILKGKCPRCRKGNMFNPKASFFSDKTLENCDHCGLHYEVETGFFWGAMYVNYAFNVALFVIISAIILLFQIELTLWQHLAAILIPVIVLYPIFMRYSRVLMLHLFGGIKYQPDITPEKKS